MKVRKQMLRVFWMGLALGAVVISPNRSLASFGQQDTTGYVLYSYYEPWRSGYYGDFGAIYLTLYEQPGGGGKYLGSGFIYSENATASNSYPGVRVTEPAIMASLAGSLQRAAASGQKVKVRVSLSYPLSISDIAFYSH